MQNEELLRARESTYEILEKYSDLYDFAPVGYLTLDRKLKINNANLTAATLLGVGRAQLIRRHFSEFLDAESKLKFVSFFEQVLASRGESCCQLKLINKKVHSEFHADINAVTDRSNSEVSNCNITISDLTAIKKSGRSRARTETIHTHQSGTQSRNSAP